VFFVCLFVFKEGLICLGLAMTLDLYPLTCAS
jgi:hypothetical protein